MTVWIVNPFDNLPTEGFRPQRYWLMAEAFVRAGHRVVYWTADFSHATKAKREKVGGEDGWTAAGSSFDIVAIPTRPYPKNVCWARVRSHRQLARDFGRLARARLADVAGSPSNQAIQQFKQSNNPDLIVASTPPLGLCDAARRVAKDCGARFVCDIQDAWPETFARLLPRGLKWIGALVFAPLHRTARRLYREADLVTGVSARYRELSGRDDFHLAYLGIGAARAGRTPYRGEARRLVYIGNLGQGYDLLTVVDAVAAREGLSLDIAGLGPQEPALRAHVAARGLADRVRFHGYLDEDRMRALLADSDVGVIPMRDDSWVGLPNKLYDYLNAGIPVLTSLTGECGELLARTDYGRIYECGNSDSLLRALDTLPDTPVSLPPELRAEEIYAQYVDHLCASASPRERKPPPLQPKLSVIVPTLDGRVPQSLRDQVAGREGVELVAVTGVSPVGRARNEGLCRSTGDYIAWVDSDDEVTDDWLAEIFKSLASAPDVVLFNAETVGHARLCRLVWDHAPGCVEPPELVREVYRNEIVQSHLFRLITRRSLWAGLSFDETIRASEDFLLLPQVLIRARRIEYLKKTLYRYLFRADSLSYTVSVPQMADDIRTALRRFDETPTRYRKPSAFGSAWVIYYALETATVVPACRKTGTLDARLAAEGRAFLFRHIPDAARSVRDAVRLLTASLGVWAIQRGLYARRFGRQSAGTAFLEKS